MTKIVKTLNAFPIKQLKGNLTGWGYLLVITAQVQIVKSNSAGIELEAVQG